MADKVNYHIKTLPKVISKCEFVIVQVAVKSKMKRFLDDRIFSQLFAENVFENVTTRFTHHYYHTPPHVCTHK